MHWQLLPRLESISVAALHRIVHALVRNRKLRDAFRIYRHAERHIESAQLRELFETDSIFVLLARGLAQRGDIRSITHLADAVTQRGIQMSVHFYTSLICGLLSDIKLRRVTHRHGRDHYAVFVLERVQMAESLLNIVRRNKIPCPPKVYYTIMYGWAILGCPKMAQKYFDRISLLKLPDSHAAGSRSGVNQTTWGILMYAYVCARDARGAMHVLERAKEWMKDTAVSGVIRTAIDNTDPDGHKTNHLINMAMTVLIRRKDAAGALALLDSFLEKHFESQSTSDTALELPATSADPVTLNLILRALLLNDQLHNAVRVYDMTHSDFKLLETPDALRPLLRYYTQKNDLDGVFLLTKRIFRLGGIPTLKELFYMVRLSIYKRDSALILYLFDRLNTTTASNRQSKFMYFIKRNPAMVPLVYWALVDGGREDDAQNIESMYGDMMSRAPDRSQLLQPPTLAQRKAVAATKAHARCISLYRDLLREIDDFPLVEMRKKLRYNARFVFELYRDLKPQDPLIGQLLEDGEQQKQWLRKWHNDQDGWQFVTHSSPTPAMGLAGSQ
ncbi:hypothetical protein EV175_002101 [Coemansia sp. RSA 1933]|nr:hypothetical protein EV175_002101 [Coemansia sp. RSA 1933]